jgi:DNA mismatch repair protein MutS2
MNKKTLRVLEFSKIITKLTDLTASELGREIAMSLLPQTDYSKVRDSLKETDDGVSYIVKRGNPPMEGISDIRGSLKRVGMGSVLSPGELLKISYILKACRNLKNYASQVNETEEDNVVDKLISCLEVNKKIEDKIKLSIVSEDEISDLASSTLGSIRRQIRGIQESIKDKLNSLVRSAKYQKFMQEPIVTMRGDRYVIPVKQEYRSEIPGIVHDSSASGATIFIEPMVLVEANNKIRQLKVKEQAEIERILQELTADVACMITSLESNISLLAKLDFIFAKARLSIDYNCVCPVLNTNGSIIIKKGRHPLLSPEEVVPIDFWVGDAFKTLVITGPNTGGKTVTLKTVGLFTLMAQAGLHIPAGEGTAISVFNKVFADIGDEQSIEQSLSTFSSHMTNIVEILKSADSSSMVLFDELGAGTDPTEGAALAMAILEDLRCKGVVTVATTHYSELKMYAVSTEGVENACCEFDVVTLKPTYKLLVGIPGKSNAFAISKRLGLPEKILKKAKDFLTQEDIKFEDVIMSIERDRAEAEKERIKTEQFRIEIEKLKNELEKEKMKTVSQREKIIREAREEARKIMIKAREEAQEILDQIKKISKEQEVSGRHKIMEELKQRLKSEIDRVEESLAVPLIPRQGHVKPPENLKPGDSVLIINLNQKGIVKVPPGKDGEAIVQAGIMEINVHVTNLKLIDEQKIESAATGLGKIGKSKAINASTEIDLRGFNVDEAVIDADKFLDDASIAGLKEVTIIHGKGTGALREGIHQFLKTNPHVKSFRLGRYGEGEAGVTIVQLK